MARRYRVRGPGGFDVRSLVVATFSSVAKQHVLRAIAEYDTRGAEEFLDVYGFEPSGDYPLIHEGRTYDSRAILGLAHRHATGRAATPDDFHAGMDEAVAILRKRGFEVTEPASVSRAARPAAAARPRAARAPRATGPRTLTARSAAAREIPDKICPTCSMALPATGVCDTCS